MRINFALLFTFLVLTSRNCFSSDSENDEPHQSDHQSKSPKTPKEFNPRRLEIDEFLGKLRESLSKQHGSNGLEFTYEQIKSMIGDGYHLIVFDCKLPSYMDLRRKAHIKSDETLSQLNSRSNCSNDDNIWLEHGSELSPVTYNHKTRSLTSPVLPFSKLLSYVVRLDICNDFMRFMRHPGYFARNYRKPGVCAAKRKMKTKYQHQQSILPPSHGYIELEGGSGKMKPPKQKDAKFFGHHYPFHQQQRFGFRNHQGWGGGGWGRPMGGCIGG